MGGRNAGAATPQAIVEAEEGRLSGVTLDAGALIALDGNDRRVLTLIARAAERGVRITIPATALAQAIRHPARQARLARLIRQTGTDLVALDGPDATAIGLLLARSGTADIVDAHVIVCAQRAGQAVITGDAADLERLAPALQLIAL
jgi:predicted nucleic acid-binding protein